METLTTNRRGTTAVKGIRDENSDMHCKVAKISLILDLKYLIKESKG
jgi:hypothetical protein